MSDAILIGVGTVVKDDPSLRVHWDLLGEEPKRAPTRIVVDASGRLPERARVLDGSVPTIIETSERNRRPYPATVTTLVSGRETVDLEKLFRTLRDHGFERLMVEGGSRILASVARGSLFDRWTVYYASVVIGGTTAPPIVGGEEAMGPEDLVPFHLEGLERLGEGYVATYGPRPSGSPAGGEPSHRAPVV